jgi:hypothetical protein
MATLARYQAFALDNAGNVLASPTVEVRDEGTASLVPLFSDRAGASGISNPFTGGSDGLVAFHVAGGVYKVTVTLGATVRTFRYVAIGTAAEHDFVITSNPPSDDGAALGSTSLKWSDLFLASGAVIDFNSGDVTITHSSNLLTFNDPISLPSLQGSVIASQAEEVAASSVVKVTTPGRQHFHPGSLKAWGTGDTNGNRLDFYNVSSITDGGAGDTSFNFSTVFANAFSGFVATARTDSTLITRVTNSNTGASLVRVLVSNTSGTATDPNETSMAAPGTQ